MPSTSSADPNPIGHFGGVRRTFRLKITIKSIIIRHSPSIITILAEFSGHPKLKKMVFAMSFMVRYYPPKSAIFHFRSGGFWWRTDVDRGGLFKTLADSKKSAGLRRNFVDCGRRWWTKGDFLFRQRPTLSAK